jgi:hypothetical protein
MSRKKTYVSFRAFFRIWADRKGWNVPEFHLVVCDWLEDLYWNGRTGVLKIFRGGAKSTILALFQAWMLRENPKNRIIDRSADDGTATKLSADTKNILMLHPLCGGMIKGKLGVERFNVIGNPDIRNASVTAYGIMSNATSSRADIIINDDCEVPKNIASLETRQKLRERLGEETHIIVPGGKLLYVGTDHTHNSIYDEKIANGYGALIIPLFKDVKRWEVDVPKDGPEAGKVRTFFPLPFTVDNPDELYVMVGIYKHSQVLDPSQYDILPEGVRLKAELPEGTVIDFSYGNPWSTYFTRKEITFKRKECKTYNSWDSQYLLKAKPIHEVRLDPDKIRMYDEHPKITYANSDALMILNNTRLTAVRSCWDCSLGKADSDDSDFAAIFQDAAGHLYWHINDILTGDVYEQCNHIMKRIVEYNIPGIIIKTAGIGGFLPAIMRKVLKEAGVQCGVVEQQEKGSKADRILSAFEAPLSGGFLHAHRSVVEGGLSEQMRDWIPAHVNQADDILDAGEGCISGLPVKIGKVVSEGTIKENHDWREAAKTYEVKVDFG